MQVGWKQRFAGSSNNIARTVVCCTRSTRSVCPFGAGCSVGVVNRLDAGLGAIKEMRAFQTLPLQAAT